jgi:hypothetical protein
MIEEDYGFFKSMVSKDECVRKALSLKHSSLERKEAQCCTGSFQAGRQAGRHSFIPSTAATSGLSSNILLRSPLYVVVQSLLVFLRPPLELLNAPNQAEAKPVQLGASD